MTINLLRMALMSFILTLPVRKQVLISWMMVSEAGFDGTYRASRPEANCEDGKYRIWFAEPGEAEGYYENTPGSSLPREKSLQISP
jgi:hypothetical protein